MYQYTVYNEIEQVYESYMTEQELEVYGMYITDTACLIRVVDFVATHENDK